MSIDHVYYVPAGMRDSQARRFDCCDRDAKHMIEKQGTPKHLVYLMHAGVESERCGLYDVIKELFFFEDPEDARWFFREGYKERLFHQGWVPGEMELWMNGKETVKINFRTLLRRSKHR